MSPRKKQQYVREFFTKDFWDRVATKLVATFISVKVWGLVSITTISTLLLLNEYISGGEWTTVNGTVYSVIFGMREIFKVSSIKQMIDSGENIEHNT